MQIISVVNFHEIDNSNLSTGAHLEEQQTGLLLNEQACNHYTQFFAADQDELLVSLSHL